MATNIRKICTKNTYISNFYAIDIWIGYFNIGSVYIKNIYTKYTFVGDIDLRTLVRSRII